MAAENVGIPESKRSKYVALIKSFLTRHMVTILFVILSLIALHLSGMNIMLYLMDIISRVSRNSFLVLALIIPVVAGMGLNFSIVLGAMAAQAVIIFVTHWGVSGFPGILLCMVLVAPLSVLLGYLTGKLFNRTKGQEMITGLILGFFAAGIYWFIFLQLVGGIIPMDNKILILSSGVGVRTTIDLTGGIRYGLDDLYRLSLPVMIIIAGAIGALYQGYSYFKSGRESMSKSSFYFRTVIILAAIAGGFFLITSGSLINNIIVPVGTWAFIAALCLFIAFFQRTKLGQDMRTVGQDRQVAAVSGIPVDRIRIMAIIFSTVLASWGHIIFLQNMGAFSAYGSHTQIGFYSIAAILIGGATVKKATIGQALLGVFLFHTLFIVAPAAGREIFGDAQIGEFFRVFVAYGVIGATLALHAWKARLQSRQKLGA
jgi:simple sugar transport system permease protein